MRRSTMIAVALLTLPGAAFAQLANSSAASVGLAGSYTAAARGFEGVAWNPAVLGMPGRPSFSLNLLQADAGLRSNSFGLSDVRKYANDTLTTADKDTLLMKVRQGDPTRPLSAGVNVGVTAISLSLGNFAVSISGVGDGQVDLSSDAVELALFGNATRRGPGQTYSGVGSGGQGWAGVTGAIAYGRQLHVVPVGTLAIGATLKLTRGIALGRAIDLGTSLQSSPTFNATLGGEALVTDVSNSTNNGFGVGLDIGGVYELHPGLRFALAVENLVSSMSWKDDNLLYYRYQYAMMFANGVFSDQTIAKDTGIAYNPNNALQAQLHDSLFAQANFPTRVRAGARIGGSKLAVLADVMVQVKSGLGSTDTKRASVGAELGIIPFLPLRAGIGTNFESGFTLAGGFGVKLGPVRLDTGISDTEGGPRKGFLIATGVSIMP